jgi:hypothetical protein
MKTHILLAGALLSLVAPLDALAIGRGGGGGGRGGFAGGSGRPMGGGGGGGGGRGGFAGGEAMHRTPSFSGAAGGANRPNYRVAGNGGGMVPHGNPGGNRGPAGGGAGGFNNLKMQPYSGNRIAGRPNFEGNQGGFNRPGGTNRPGAGGGGQQWAGAGGNRPNFGNRPGAGGGGEQWAGAGGNRPNMGNRPGAGGGGEQWAGAGGNQPNWNNRPGAGGSGERWPNAGNLPNGPNRPGQGGSGEQWGQRWPNGGQRPNQPGQNGLVNRNNFGDRTNVFGNNSNIGNNNNNTIGNRTNINTGNQGVNVSNTTNNSINNVSGNRNWNGGGGNWQNNNWQGPHNYWNNNYANWHPGNWSNWNYHPAAWYGAGAATGWMADSYAYSNPFYVAPTAVAYNAAVPAMNYNSYVDYSQPIAQPPQQVYNNYGDNYATGYDSGNVPETYAADPNVAQQPADQQAVAAQQNTYGRQNADGQQTAAMPTQPPVDDSAPPEAFQRFEAARAAFKANDYHKALAEVDHAIKLLPSDATMHEFRALVLFAEGKYHEAAEGVYAVLSMGPGWTWETLMSLYANEETYTRQLRGLEAYCRKNPNASDGRFLLGYQYIVMNHVPQGVNQLQHFAQLVPDDKLAPQLIKAFSAPPTSQATAELPAQSGRGEPQP